MSEPTPLYETLVERARAGVAAPRQAIKAKCLECVGYVRADITGCTSRQCPLWMYRPYQAKKRRDTPNQSSVQQKAPAAATR